MKVYNIGWLLIIYFILLNCASEKALKSEIITKDGLEILYGEISKEQLFFDYPEWKKLYNSYKVDHSILDSLKISDFNDIEIDIFLGTWCGDSKREVPRFLKIIYQTELSSKVHIHLYAVDRKKNLNNNLAQNNNIQRVATFIIKKDALEIGRIVETPIVSLENDFLKILKNL